jgi:UrcA family protein
MTMNMNIKIVVRCLGMGLIAAAFLGPKVFAADPTDSVRTRTVKFEDLSLNDQSGAATLYQRIHQAAKQVCEQPGADQRNLKALQMQQSCMVRAESRAVDNVHSGALSAYYQMTLGHPYAVSAQNNVK